MNTLQIALGRVGLLVALLWCQTGAAAAPHRYFAILFSHQEADDRRVDFGVHTFATFVEEVPSETVDAPPTLIKHDMSWEVASGRPLGRPEPGINVSLEQTLADAFEYELRVTQWGPFEIEPELFAMAVRRIERLEANDYMYKLADRRTRDYAFNCIHALSDVYTARGYLDTGTARGDDATHMVAHFFSPFYRGGDDSGHYVVHQWVADQLGLGSLPIRRVGLSR